MGHCPCLASSDSYVPICPILLTNNAAKAGKALPSSSALPSSLMDVVLAVLALRILFFCVCAGPGSVAEISATVPVFFSIYCRV